MALVRDEGVGLMKAIFANINISTIMVIIPIMMPNLVSHMSLVLDEGLGSINIFIMVTILIIITS